MDRAKKRVKADARGRAMAWLFLLCALLASLLGLTLQRGLYQSYLFEMSTIKDTPQGLARQYDFASLFLLYEAIPRALNGDLDVLRLNVRDLDGQERQAFNDREIAHMADVAHLYCLAKVVLAASALALIGFVLWNWRRVKRGESRAGIAKGALLGVLDVLLLAGAVALWAVIDFRSAFWAFHLIAFTNDLWLLDPNDMLIQMMPQAFFESTVLKIALNWACCAAVWCAYWHGVLCRERKKAGAKA